MTPSVLIFGLGYCGAAVARDAAALGWRVTGTSRNPDRSHAPAGTRIVAFDAAGTEIAAATHILTTAAPDQDGDPVLARYAGMIGVAPPSLRWIGYLSTTGVYGDRAGGWVDEDTPAAPTAKRSAARLAAEDAWRATGTGRMVDVFRVGGIYGPGRSILDDVRAGTARRVIKPGHMFGRIHREDIAAAVLAAMRQVRPHGARVLNLVDDTPAENAVVTEEAARLLGVEAPPAIPFEVAQARMSPMGLSFWNESRKVASAKTQAALGLRWRYPSYREGLRAILEQESVERGGEQS